MPARFVYRNRPDDRRRPSEMHFCSHCNGWYGVSHEYSHYHKDTAATWARDCACRFCREAMNQPVTGRYGFFTAAEEWKPPQQGEQVTEIDEQGWGGTRTPTDVNIAS